MILQTYLAILLLMGQQPTVYLTVDDGPSKGSRHLHEPVDSEQVKVTLFFEQYGDPVT